MTEQFIEEHPDRIALYELWENIMDDLVCSAGPSLVMAVLANVYLKQARHAKEHGCTMHTDLYKYMGDKCADMAAVFKRSLEEHEADHQHETDNDFFL